MCAGPCTSVDSRFLVKSSNQNGISAKRSFSSFLSLLKDSCPNLLVASSSLRYDTEPEDELAAALFQRLGLDICLANNTFPIFGQSWLLTADPLAGHPWSLQSLPSDRTASVSSSNFTVGNRFKS